MWNNRIQGLFFKTFWGTSARKNQECEAFLIHEKSLQMFIEKLVSQSPFPSLAKPTKKRSAKNEKIQLQFFSDFQCLTIINSAWTYWLRRGEGMKQTCKLN